MGYLVRTMHPGSAIQIAIDESADMVELERRMQIDGIRIGVVVRDGSKARISVRAPAGITPKLITDTGQSGYLALTRTAGEQVAITIKPGAVPVEAMDDLARDGVTIALAEGCGRRAVLLIKAPERLLVLREELASQMDA